MHHNILTSNTHLSKHGTPLCTSLHTPPTSLSTMHLSTYNTHHSVHYAPLYIQHSPVCPLCTSLHTTLTCLSIMHLSIYNTRQSVHYAPLYIQHSPVCPLCTSPSLFCEMSHWPSEMGSLLVSDTVFQEVVSVSVTSSSSCEDGAGGGEYCWPRSFNSFTSLKTCDFDHYFINSLSYEKAAFFIKEDF